MRARREPSQAARPAAVTDPVTTKSAPARQAGLPAPRFLSNHRNEDGGAGLQRTARSHVGETRLRSGPFGGAAAMPAVTLRIPTS